MPKYPVELVAKPVLGLFVHNGNELWESGPNYPNHSPEDEKRVTSYPIVVLLRRCDFKDGEGWGRSFVEKHGTILQSYFYDVCSSAESYAILVSVESEKDVLALAESSELLDYVPEKL